MHDAWMPFGGGPRSKYTSNIEWPLLILSDCIGLHLALMELRLGTVRFFQTFPNARVSSREHFTDDDMAAKSYLLLFPKGKRCLIDSC